MQQRVVILSAFLSPFRSGAEACVEEVAVRLVDDFCITIITAKLRSDLPREDLLAGKVPVIRVGVGMKIDKWLYPILAPFAVRRLHPDIVHGVLETFAGLALHMTRFVYPSAKRILTLQTTNRRFLRSRILRTPHVITAISNALMLDARERGRKDVILIPNGIDSVAIDRAVASAKRNPHRVLFVGRLEAMKGIDILLRAIAHLRDSRRAEIPASLHLRIVGDGSRRTEYERLANDLHIADIVTFVGRKKPQEVYSEYAQAEIFCGFSRSEALGNVFLEAQAAGCAVIGTHVGGIPDIVLDGKTGLLVPPNDADAAVEALALLCGDNAMRGGFAERGREHAKKYDWGIIAEKYAGVYAKV